MAITPESLTQTLHSVANSDYVLALKATPYYPWDATTNKRSVTRTGTIITVVAPAREYEKFTVTIEGENYDNLFTEGKAFKVTFENFIGKFYHNFNTNEYIFTAKASQMVITK